MEPTSKPQTGKTYPTKIYHICLEDCGGDISYHPVRRRIDHETV